MNKQLRPNAASKLKHQKQLLYKNKKQKEPSLYVSRFVFNEVTRQTPQWNIYRRIDFKKKTYISEAATHYVNYSNNARASHTVPQFSFSDKMLLVRCFFLVKLWNFSGFETRLRQSTPASGSTLEENVRKSQFLLDA